MNAADRNLPPQEKRVAQAKPKKRLKPMSDKRKVLHSEYLKALAKRKLDEGCRCVRCNRKGKVDGHHLNGRLKENILLFVLLCRACHDWVHCNGKEARAIGLLL